jgi:hypothetical protein
MRVQLASSIARQLPLSPIRVLPFGNDTLSIMTVQGIHDESPSGCVALRGRLALHVEPASAMRTAQLAGKA